MDNFAADGIFVDAPPGRVFRAFLDPEDVRVWMGAGRVEVDAKTGGRFAASRADGSSVSGVIAVLQPDEFVGIGDYTWTKAGARRGPMRLSLHITPRHEGSWITIRQDDLDGPSSGDAGDWKTFATETRSELVRATVELKRHVEGI